MSAPEDIPPYHPQEAVLPYPVDVLLVTVTEVETRAMFTALNVQTDHPITTYYLEDKTYYHLGFVGGAHVWLVRSEMGAGTPGGALATLYTAIVTLQPPVLIMVGIAFGLQPAHQQIGDVLVAQQILSYEPQRVGTGPTGEATIIPRGDRTSAPMRMLDRCRDAALHWPSERAQVHIGLVLSGEKLLGHAPTIAGLLAQTPEAIGSEMEGAGLSVAATQHKVDWLLIKAICDWTDGQNSKDQQTNVALAARNAAQFTLYLLDRGGFATYRPVIPTFLHTQLKEPPALISGASPALGPSPAVKSLDKTTRENLLDTLQERYTNRLNSGLAKQVQLQIGMHTRPDTVNPFWRGINLRGPTKSRSIDPDKPIIDIFDAQGGHLLVLGDSGSGKTTLLVNLALSLTLRARDDSSQCIPVMLSLSTWKPEQTIRQWLTNAICNLIGASEQFSAQIAQGREILLLLDGLDEISTEDRIHFITSIENYLGRGDFLPPIVITCRSHDYSTIGAKLPISGAIELEPLNLQTIEQAIIDIPGSAGILTALHSDNLLLKLAETPLIVNMLLMAYANTNVILPTANTTNEHLNMLLFAYSKRMLLHRTSKQKESIESTLKYIIWLARSLSHSNQTDFLIDTMQSHLLPNKWWALGYRLILLAVYGTAGTLVGSIGGAFYGLVFGIASSLFNNQQIQIIVANFYANVAIGQFIGAIIGLFVGLSFGLLDGTNPLSRAERISWSWNKMLKQWRRVIAGILLTFVFGAILGAAFGLYYGLEFIGILGMMFAIVSGVVFGPIVGLVFWFDGGWEIQNLPDRLAPEQGIYNSLRSGLLRGLTGSLAGAICSLAVGSFLFQMEEPNLKMLLLFISLLSGIFLSLIGGVGSFLQHFTLRSLLSRANLFPFHAVDFLDAMSDLLILERDGAVYRFRHILLRDFFAGLTDEEIKQLAREIEQ